MFDILNKICECTISIHGLKGHVQLLFDLRTLQNISIYGKNITVYEPFEDHF